VLDVRLPGQSGLDLQHELTRSGVQIPIIFMTGHGDIPMSVRAMKARGRVSDQALPKGRSARRDPGRDRARPHLTPRTAGRQGLRQRYEQLTPREREVMALVVAGLLNKQIAAELATAERTIKFHRAHIMQKMEADSLAELVTMAGRRGIASKGCARPVPRDS
jgi:FixJ family two-component response regulator